MKEKNITRVSLKDLHKIKSLTDWKRVDAMTEEDIERAAATDPDAPMTTAADWANARMVWPAGKEPISIRVDRDIVQWFGNRGTDYRAKINAVLREFVEAQERQQKPPARSVSDVNRKHPRKSPKRAAVKSRSTPKLTKGLRHG
jgi:uncharacterized protein (DUF4415 family)